MKAAVEPMLKVRGDMEKIAAVHKRMQDQARQLEEIGRPMREAMEQLQKNPGFIAFQDTMGQLEKQMQPFRAMMERLQAQASLAIPAIPLPQVPAISLADLPPIENLDIKLRRIVREELERAGRDEETNGGDRAPAYESDGVKRRPGFSLEPLHKP